MNETEWKAKLRKEFNRYGLSLSLHGHGMQEPGWPDLYVSSGIWSGWIELKSEKREVTPAQRIIGRKLQRNGQFVVLRLMNLSNGLVRVSDAEERVIVDCESGPLDAAGLLTEIRLYAEGLRKLN